MLRMRQRKDIDLPINIFHADTIRREIGESVPITLFNDEDYEDNEFINADTTKAILALNNHYIHTKELGVAKKTKHNYVTALLLRGIRIIKNYK